MERELAAILSADVKGYPRLMSDDEEAMIHTLKTYLVGTFGAICTEQLNIKGITANGGAYKTG